MFLFSVALLVFSTFRPLEVRASPFPNVGLNHQNIYTVGTHVTGRYRADAVKEAFLHSWNGYKHFAWGYDELLPVSKRGGNSRNGWGASIADALSTAILMDFDDEVVEMLDYLDNVNFSETGVPGQVSLFETTIRYLGGLLSGYDLLKGPYAGQYRNKPGINRKVDRLLEQAVVLADRMSFAFDTPSGIPYNNLNFLTNGSSDTTNGLATTGTLILEWTRLSDLTGNPKYARLAAKAESYLLAPEPALGEPFPGLLGTDIDINTGLFINSRGGWSGGTDSFYEYLLKMWIYSPADYDLYKDRWIKAVESTQEYLISNSKGQHHRSTFVAEYRNSSSLHFEEGHLTCFIGGNLILGGHLLDRQDIMKTGLDLTSGCHDTYTSTATGIGPERWRWDAANVPREQLAFFQKNGFYITVASYDLRPETIESYYHAWKLTGNPKYQEWAWDAFERISAVCRTDAGFSSIRNVNREGGDGLSDFQESFWFAEVLKYLYLIFTPHAEVGVGRGTNRWVFNTEAHPFKVKDYAR